MNVKIIATETRESSEEQFVYAKTDDNRIYRVQPSLNKPGLRRYELCIRKLFKDVFLPCGYPDSLSPDYLTYQLWDTLQASCSTINNTLATKAVLQGIGVGDSSASALSAAITWILKDGTGMAARIVYAWAVGSSLDFECKKWRLFADIINDVAICLEIAILPLFPNQASFIICLSTSFKAIVGTAGGATRAAITQHQALKHNTADVSAKDGSQETCVNLLTSFLGMAIISTFQDPTVIWTIFIVMTCLHLYANYKAVKSLNFTHFNEDRLVTVLWHYFHYGTILTTVKANYHESVFFGSSAGCSMEGLTYKKELGVVYKFSVHLYKDRRYLILPLVSENTVYVLLKKDVQLLDVIEAYFHASLQGLATSVDGEHEKGPESIAKRLRKELRGRTVEEIGFPERIEVDRLGQKWFEDFKEALVLSDWNLERISLNVGEWRCSWNEGV